MDYRRALEEGYAFQCSQNQISRLEYLGDFIFDFTTYDSEKSEEFAIMALEACEAISTRKTHQYIADPVKYRWFLLMVNMPFFAPRLNWGTSIRGAWWDTDSLGARDFICSGLELDGADVEMPLKFTTDEWKKFIAAVLEFAGAAEGTKESA